MFVDLPPLYAQERPALTERLKYYQLIPLGLLPGMPVALAQGGLYKVAHHLRFRASATAYANLTPAAGTQDKYLIRVAVKRGTLGSEQVILSADTSLDDAIGFDSSDRLFWDFAGTRRLVSTAVFRDPTAWYIFEFIYDAANATSGLKARVMLGNVRSGVQEEITVWTTDTRSSITTGTSKFSTAVVHNLGRRANGATNYFSGYLADFSWRDNYATPGYSGTINAQTGGWDLKPPASPRIRLKFADNSSTINLGTDSGSLGSAWTMNNFSVAAGTTNDSMVDTPTNYGTDTGLGGEVRGNYCVLNAILPANSLTLSNGNLTGTDTTSFNSALGTMLIPTAVPIYFEVEVGATTNASRAIWLGLATELASRVVTPQSASGIWAIYWDSSRVIGTNGTASGSTVDTAAAGAVLQVAADPVNGKVWVGKNNVWYDSSNGTTGNPSTGANPTFTITVAGLFPFIGGYDNSFNANFGQRPFTHTAPTGFKALCTQNLAPPAVPKSTNGFVAATDSGAGIVATLATARPSTWTNFFNIYKRRDSTDQWYFNASDDVTNAIANPTLAAKAALSLSGTSFIGYSIRCDSGYPARTGTVSHTNGVADTVTNNLGTARRLIWLVREDAAGVNFYQFHPDNSSGKLNYLNSSVAEATDGAITNVTTNSFDVGASLATGTYRYFEMAESSGFLALGVVTGNGSADGPAIMRSLRPKLYVQKQRAVAGEHLVVDSIRSPYNIVSTYSALESTAAESTFEVYDLLATGIKTRTSNVTVNSNTVVSLYWAFGEASLKSARAR